MPTFQRFDAAGCGFPPPRVPLLPVLSMGDLTFRPSPSARALSGAGVRHFSRGRYALHAAYHAAGVGVGGALLAPAYHCRTMLDPALALGAEVIFYALGEDLRPDVAAVEALLAEVNQPVKALLVPHYFGFPQPPEIMSSLAELCRLHGIFLIEDCSHGWQIATEQGPRCEFEKGRMVVASPYKFFPSPDGGTLWANESQLDDAAPSKASATVDELKGLVSVLAHRGRAAGLGAAGAAGAPAARGQDYCETGELISIHYQRSAENQCGLALSRAIVRHTRQDAAAARRRANYMRWLSATCKLGSANALFDTLPPDCTPYMFPLLLQAPDPHFFQLKQLGMPVWRWDDMAVSPCSVAARMRLHLLHLPCHQSLSELQMDWMTSTVAQVLAA
jgi:perosamine synthetase